MNNTQLQVIVDIFDEFSDAEAPFDGAAVQSEQRRVVAS